MRDELGIKTGSLARPLQAAWISATSFASLAAIQIAALLIASSSPGIPTISLLSLVSLAALGAFGGYLGGAPLGRGVARHNWRWLGYGRDSRDRATPWCFDKLLVITTMGTGPAVCPRVEFPRGFTNTEPPMLKRICSTTGATRKSASRRSIPRLKATLRCCRRPERALPLVFTKGCNSQEERLDSLPARLRITQPRPEVSGAPDRATLCQSRSRLETVDPYCEPGAIQSLLSAIRESASSVPHCSACIRAATRSSIMMHGIFADAPTTRSTSIPSNARHSCRAKQKVATNDVERHIQCIGRMSFRYPTLMQGRPDDPPGYIDGIACLSSGSYGIGAEVGFALSLASSLTSCS
jgi:hypothetical protein